MMVLKYNQNITVLTVLLKNNLFSNCAKLYKYIKSQMTAYALYNSTCINQSIILWKHAAQSNVSVHIFIIFCS